MLVGIAEERDNLVFLTCIERARLNFSACFLNLLHQRLEFGAIPAPGEYRKSF